MKPLFLVMAMIFTAVSAQSNGWRDLDKEYSRRLALHLGKEFSLVGQRLARERGIAVIVPQAISAGTAEWVAFSAKPKSGQCELAGYWTYRPAHPPIGGKYGKSTVAEVFVIEGQCRSDGSHFPVKAESVVPLFSCTDDVAHAVMGDCE